MDSSPIKVEDEFKIRRYKSQSDNQDLCGGNPHKMGPENLRNLSGYVPVEHWPWARG